jgi:hypothetical protein
MNTTPSRAFAVTAAKLTMAAGCLAMWWLMVAGLRRISVPSFWPAEQGYLFTDILATVAIAVLITVVWVDRRSWLWALSVLVPIVGLVVSLISFWRLGGRIVDRLTQDENNTNFDNSTECREP